MNQLQIHLCENILENLVIFVGDFKFMEEVVLQLNQFRFEFRQFACRLIASLQ
jgi:hypothetical protein